MKKPTLYVLSGLPGVGKSSIAKGLANALQAAYVRIDTIEQELRDCGFDNIQTEGYRVAYRIAHDILSSGCSVVADSVNPIAITRKEWISIANQADCDFRNIEIVCSDENEHRSRVENREREVPNLKLPTWSQVISHDYEPWEMPRNQIDTFGKSADESLQELISRLKH